MPPAPRFALASRLRRGGLALDLAMVWLATAPAWWPLLSGRLVGTHDGYYHLYRLFELDRALRAGDVYPRWAPDLALGYGYPVFNYYPPLLLYLAAPFALAGTGLIVALNLGQLSAALAAGASAYLLARDLFGRLPGVVAGVLYGALPYLLIDLYVRGAVAETLGLALLPLVTLMLRRVATAPTRRSVALAGLAVGFLALGHNITSLLGLPVLAAFAALAVARSPDRWAARLVALAAAGVFGLLLGAIYWLPALAERDLVHNEVLTTLFYDFHNHFQPLRDVVQRSLTFEYRYDYFAGFLFRAGLVQVAAAAVGAAVAFARLPTRRPEVVFWAAVAAGALLLQSSRSAPLWEALPLLAFTQFPWRMLTLLGLGSVLLAAAGIAALPPRWRLPASSALIAVWLAASLWQLRPALLDLRESEVGVGPLGRIELERHLVATTTAGEYTPRWDQRGTFEGWRDPLPGGPIDPLEVAAVGRNSVTVRVSAPTAGTLSIDQYFFPGWEATVDGRPASVRPVGDRGLLGVEVPAGGSEVAIRFGGTPLRDASAALSGIALALLLGLAAWPSSRPGRQPTGDPPPVARELPRPGLVSARVALAGALGLTLHAGALAALASPSSGALASPAGGARLVAARAEFDAGPRLLGLTDQGDGSLALYWSTLRPVDRDLDVALRLIGPDGRVLGRRDKAPRYGLRPTSTWRPGAIVRDLADVELAPGAPSGDVDLVLGLHDASGYVAPISGDVVRWRDTCPCAGPGPDGVGVRVGRLSLSAPPDPAVQPLPRAVERGRTIGPSAAGRIQLLDLDLHLDPSVEVRPAWAPLTDRIVRRLPGALRRALDPGQSPSVARLGGPGGALATLAAGDALAIDLRWRALADVDDDYAVFTHLLDHQQRLVAQDDEWPRRGFSPTSMWHPGEQTLDYYRIKLQPDTPPGRYALTVGLYRRADLRPLPWSGEPAGRDQVVLGSVKVAPVPPDGPVVRAVPARFGQAISLLGFDDELGTSPVALAPVRAGSTIAVAPRWRADAAPERDYTVFVHLLDGTGKLVANGDAPPLGGGFPTSVWEAGETIQDRYQIAVPADLRGPARLVIGLYRPDNGERLRTEAGADSVTAAMLEVSPP